MALFGKSQPSSIHDLDTPEARAARQRQTRSGGLRLVAAVAVAAVAGGGAYWLLAGDDAVKRADPDHSNLATGPQLGDPDKAHVDVLMDGWSYRTLDGATVYAQVSGSPAAVDFRPATAADLAELLSSTPALVASAMGRMVADDPTLSCTQDGCSTKSGDVSVDLLLDPTGVAGLGDSYDGYGVEHGLYVAQVPTAGSTGSVELSVEGYQPLAVAAGAPSEDEEGMKLVAGPDNGYLKSRFLVGASLGLLFNVDPQWQGSDDASDPTRYETNGPSVTDSSALAAVQAQNPPGVATGGLGVAFAPAQSWSSGHLTYATSPTTGCGPEVLCVPGTASVTVEREVRDYAQVCSPDADASGVAALHDVVLKVKLSAPTHQYGLGDTNARWGKTPDLVSGGQEFRMGVLGLYDGADPHVRAAGGRVDSGAPTSITIDDALGGIRFDEVHWTRC